MKKLVLAGLAFLLLLTVRAATIKPFYGDIRVYGNIQVMNNPATTDLDSTTIPYLYVDSVSIGGLILTKEYFEQLLPDLPDSIMVTYLSSEDSIVGKNLAVDSVNCYVMTLGDSTVSFITKGDTLLTYERALEIFAEQQVQIDSKKPYHGIETHGSLTFDDGTHVFTIGAGNNKYWYKGTVYETASAITCDLDNFITITANTLYFVYFDDETGTLIASESAWNLKEHCPVSVIYWNGTSGAVGDETHNHTRDIDWHTNAHLTIGSRYYSGLEQILPSVATSAQLQISGGTILDEDIFINSSEQINSRHFYQVSAGVYTWANSDLPYLGSIGVPQYVNTNTYTLTNVGNNNYTNYWVYGSNDVERNIYIIPTHSTASYNTVVLARVEDPPNLAGVGLDPEMKLIYRFIFNGNGTYEESEDYRRSSALPSGGSVATSASSVSFIPYGNIISVDVQSAISELEDDKSNIADTSKFNQNGNVIIPKSATSLNIDSTNVGFLESTGDIIGNTYVYNITDNDASGGVHLDRYRSADDKGARIRFSRARGNSITPLINEPGDIVGEFFFRGYDAGGWANVAGIQAKQPIEYPAVNTEASASIEFLTKDTLDAKFISKMKFMPEGQLLLGEGIDFNDARPYRLYVDGNLWTQGNITSDTIKAATAEISGNANVTGNLGIGLASSTILPLDVFGNKYQFSYSANSGAANTIYQRSYGTRDIPLIIPTNTNVTTGQFTYKVYDGANWQNVGRFLLYGGITNTGKEFGSFVLQTKDSTESNPTEKFRMYPNGHINIGGDYDEPSEMLKVYGNISTTGNISSDTSKVAVSQIGTNKIYQDGTTGNEKHTADTVEVNNLVVDSTVQLQKIEYEAPNSYTASVDAVGGVLTIDFTDHNLAYVYIDADNIELDYTGATYGSYMIEIRFATTYNFNLVSNRFITRQGLAPAISQQSNSVTIISGYFSEYFDKLAISTVEQMSSYTH